jgi:hypothetical protein
VKSEGVAEIHRGFDIFPYWWHDGILLQISGNSAAGLGESWLGVPLGPRRHAEGPGVVGVEARVVARSVRRGRVSQVSLESNDSRVGCFSRSDWGG